MSSLHSMTGFASQSHDLPIGHLNLELRAVNNRYLEINFRMGDELRALETRLRESIAAKVSRGKLECRIHFAPQTQTATAPALNSVALENLLAVAAQAQPFAPDAKPLSLGEMLRWPGVLNETPVDSEALHAAVLEHFAAVLDDFNAARAREGEKLAAVLQERLAALRELAQQLRPRVPEIVAVYRDKLHKRLAELSTDLDPDRVVQEVTLFAQKIDVDEELDRLAAHSSEVERILKHGGAAGKRLDFLMQELNREANTLGSKAAALDLARTSVELKVLIEQMREQVQNVE